MGYIAKAQGRWSIAALHDLVSDDASLFVNFLVRELSDAGVIEAAAPPEGGLARQGVPAPASK